MKEKFNGKKVRIRTYNSSDARAHVYQWLALDCARKSLSPEQMLDKIQKSDDETHFKIVNINEDSERPIPEHQLKYKDDTVVISFSDVELSADFVWQRRLLIVQKDNESTHLPTNVFFTTADVKGLCNVRKERTHLAELFLGKTNLFQFCEFAEQVCPDLCKNENFIKTQVDYICSNFSEDDINAMFSRADDQFKQAQKRVSDRVRLSYEIPILSEVPASYFLAPSNAFMKCIKEGVNGRISELKLAEKKIMGWTP
jgi:hypothetical protein